MEHGRTLERLDAYKTKQQQQQMMQQQDQQQIRDLHKESLDQILSLEERIRQLELQEFQEKPAATTTTTTTTTKTTMPTTKISLTDQHKSGTKDNKAMKSIGDLKKRGDEDVRASTSNHSNGNFTKSFSDVKTRLDADELLILQLRSENQQLRGVIEDHGSKFQILVNQCSSLEGKRQSLENQLQVERLNAGEQITFLEQKLRGVQDSLIEKIGEVNRLHDNNLPLEFEGDRFRAIFHETLKEVALPSASNAATPNAPTSGLVPTTSSAAHKKRAGGGVGVAGGNAGEDTGAARPTSASVFSVGAPSPQDGSATPATGVSADNSRASSAKTVDSMLDLAETRALNAKLRSLSQQQRGKPVGGGGGGGSGGGGGGGFFSLGAGITTPSPPGSRVSSVNGGAGGGAASSSNGVFNGRATSAPVGGGGRTTHQAENLQDFLKSQDYAHQNRPMTSIPYNYNPGSLTDPTNDNNEPFANGPTHNNFFRDGGHSKGTGGGGGGGGTVPEGRGGASPYELPDKQMPGLGCMPRTPTPMWVEPWSDPDVRRVGSPCYRGQTPDDAFGVRVLGSPPPSKDGGKIIGDEEETQKAKSASNVNELIHKENMAKANPPPTIDDEFSRGSTGPVMILEVQWEGKYIKLFNTSADADEDLSDHLLQQNVGGHPVAVFKLPSKAIMKPNGTLTVWTECSGARHCPPTDYLWKEQLRWGTGPECVTILCRPSGQAVSWATAPNKWASTPNPYDERDYLSVRSTPEPPVNITDADKERLTQYSAKVVCPTPATAQAFLTREKEAPPLLHGAGGRKSSAGSNNNNNNNNNNHNHLASSSFSSTAIPHTETELNTPPLGKGTGIGGGGVQGASRPATGDDAGMLGGAGGRPVSRKTSSRVSGLQSSQSSLRPRVFLGNNTYNYSFE